MPSWQIAHCHLHGVYQEERRNRSVSLDVNKDFQISDKHIAFKGVINRISRYHFSKLKNENKLFYTKLKTNILVQCFYYDTSVLLKYI